MISNHLLSKETDELIKDNKDFYQFKLFFAGLAFTIFAFIAVHPFIKPSFFLKTIESISLLFFLLTGLILLAQLNGIMILPKSTYPLSPLKIKIINFINLNFFIRPTAYWTCFLLGFGTIFFGKIIYIFR